MEAKKTKCLYTTLGVQKSATQDQIKSAYKKLALKWHPDKHKEEDRERATEEFKIISEAYSVLSNEKRRAYYDKNGTIEGADDDAEAQEFMDEVFTMFFAPGKGASPFSDFDDFIKILEGDNDKKSRKIFRDLGRNVRTKGGRAGIAARKHQQKQMKKMEMQMMSDMMGMGGMEEMMMAMMMMDGADMPDFEEMEEIERMMAGKSGKASKGADLSKEEIKLMEQMFGGKAGMFASSNKGKGKKQSDDEWETDSEGEDVSGQKNKVDVADEDDDGWETDSN